MSTLGVCSRTDFGWPCCVTQQHGKRYHSKPIALNRVKAVGVVKQVFDLAGRTFERSAVGQFKFDRSFLFDGNNFHELSLHLLREYHTVSTDTKTQSISERLTDSTARPL